MLPRVSVADWNCWPRRTLLSLLFLTLKEAVPGKWARSLVVPEQRRGAVNDLVYGPHETTRAGGLERV
jgi:hypothetical protein